MEMNNGLVSRIHRLAEELNRLCETPDIPDFKKQAETLVQEVDDIGYRILSVHSLSDEEMLLLPTNKEEQVQAIRTLTEKIHDPELSNEEIYHIRAEIRQWQRELIMQYCTDPSQPWFYIMPHGWRLLVYNEEPKHPMSRFAEMNRVNGLPELRSEYELLLWELRILQEQHPDTDAAEFLLSTRRSEVFLLHTKLLQLCLRHRKQKRTEYHAQPQLEILNTMLLQAAEMGSPLFFRDNMFWWMYEHLKKWVNA